MAVSRASAAPRWPCCRSCRLAWLAPGWSGRPPRLAFPPAVWPARPPRLADPPRFADPLRLAEPLPGWAAAGRPPPLDPPGLDPDGLLPAGWLVALRPGFWLAIRLPRSPP